MKPSPKPTRIEDACSTLHPHLFGGRCDLGNLGKASDRIFVYVWEAKHRWRGQTPHVWEGWPLEWRFGVGRPKPFEAA